MLRTTAIAAAALVGTAGAVASPALAASARVQPVYDTGSLAWVRASILLAPEDACIVQYQSMVFGAYPGAPIPPIQRSKVLVFNACRAQSSTLWEDGSITGRVAGAIDTSSYADGKHLVGLVIWTHRARSSRWVRHGAVRSFWHRSTLPTVQIPDCSTGPC